MLSGHNIRTIHDAHAKSVVSICVYVPKERNTRLDKLYDKAKNNPSFKRKLMKYMRLNKMLYAMIHHMKAYGTLTKPYKKILDEVFGKHKHEYTIQSLEDIRHQKLLELE